MKQKSNDFAFIHGLRVLSSAWVVLLHEYLFALLAPNVNITELSDVSSVFFKYSTDLSFRIVEFLPLLTVVCLIEIIDRFHWYLRCRYVFRFEWVFNDLHFYEKDAKKSKIQCLSLLLASLYQVKYFDS